MRRRTFVRMAGAASAGALLPLPVLSHLTVDSKTTLIQKLLLKDYHQEDEEYPIIVGNQQGNLWMFSMKRNKYPNTTEVLSSFKLSRGKWEELNPVTAAEGQYEAHTATCAPGGLPIVAWTEKIGDDWFIKVCQMEGKGFSSPETLPSASTRVINPVLHSRNQNRYWIAWEKLEKGKLSIELCKNEGGAWSQIISISKEEASCFDPAIAEDKNGDLFLAYGFNEGLHQNIEMVQIDGAHLTSEPPIPIAIGGGFKNRINVNAHPALAFDIDDQLWISYENNRDAHRLEDGDNYTGDRCCAILSYQNGKVLEPESGKWLFRGKNDHLPSFFKDNKGQLILATHCGGDFVGNPFWKYRLSRQNSGWEWTQPETILQTQQKSILIPPAIGFDAAGKLWLATCLEKREHKKGVTDTGVLVNACYTQLALNQYTVPKTKKSDKIHGFKPTIIQENLPGLSELSVQSGHPKTSKQSLKIGSSSYLLTFGNLHEHTENSPCWPAGTDGTLHEDYRFGMFSENYDFVGITDHGGSMTETYWRKNLRLADFYNEPGYFVAIPAMEWTLTSDQSLNDIQHGAGHYNVVFKTVADAEKFIRNEHEIFAASTPETNNVEKLWKLLRSKEIDCVTIPHHPADEVHPVDWHVYDEEYVPVVELFQCRGNAEYPGCPREFNLTRHQTTDYRRAYVDYALKDKKYKLGFIASGDHNSMGIGAAALWVKELSREGIIEALKSKRCFGTTGDKIIVDFRINGHPNGSSLTTPNKVELDISVECQSDLASVEILKNSKVVQKFQADESMVNWQKKLDFTKQHLIGESSYYYARAIQKNKEIAWSSPIWVSKELK